MTEFMENLNSYSTVAILVMAYIMTVVSVSMVIKYKKRWIMVLPLLVWSAHLAIYYSLFIFAIITNTTLDAMFHISGLTILWSNLQRLNGVATMVFMTYLLLREIKYDYFQ